MITLATAMTMHSAMVQTARSRKKSRFSHDVYRNHPYITSAKSSVRGVRKEKDNFDDFQNILKVA